MASETEEKTLFRRISAPNLTQPYKNQDNDEDLQLGSLPHPEAPPLAAIWLRPIRPEAVRYETGTGAERSPGRLRGSERRRPTSVLGPRNLFQSSSVWGAPQRGGEGVRIPPPRWDYDTVPDIGVRERADEDRCRRKPPESDPEAAVAVG